MTFNTQPYLLEMKSTKDYLFSLICGPHIYYFDDFNYCVIFVDHYTKYIWYYSFKHKSHVYNVFVHFKALAEKYFNRSIIFLYIDNGGNTKLLINSSPLMVFPISPYLDAHLKTMISFHDVIDRSLKLVFHSLHMHHCPLLIRIMSFLLMSI